jgi:hypothetical protein
MIDRASLFPRVPIIIGDAPMDFAVAGDGREPWYDLAILTNGLLYADHNRAVEEATSWMEFVRGEHKEFHNGLGG